MKHSLIGCFVPGSVLISELRTLKHHPYSQEIKIKFESNRWAQH